MKTILPRPTDTVKRFISIGIPHGAHHPESTCGEHRAPLLSECPGWMARVSVLLRTGHSLCPVELANLFHCEPEHEIVRETTGIPGHDLFQDLGDQCRGVGPTL